MLDAASSSRNTSILLSSHVRLGTWQVFHPPVTELSLNDEQARRRRTAPSSGQWPLVDVPVVCDGLECLPYFSRPEGEPPGDHENVAEVSPSGAGRATLQRGNY